MVLSLASGVSAHAAKRCDAHFIYNDEGQSTSAPTWASLLVKECRLVGEWLQEGKRGPNPDTETYTVSRSSPGRGTGLRWVWRSCRTTVCRQSPKISAWVRPLVVDGGGGVPRCRARSLRSLRWRRRPYRAAATGISSHGGDRRRSEDRLGDCPLRARTHQPVSGAAIRRRLACALQADLVDHGCGSGRIWKNAAPRSAGVRLGYSSDAQYLQGRIRIAPRSRRRTRTRRKTTLRRTADGQPTWKVSAARRMAWSA